MNEAGRQLKFHAALAETLLNHDVDVLFGVIGDANLYAVDSYIRSGRGKYVAAANEAGALLMAIGYAAVSGRVGVASVTHGPGLINTLNPLIEGVRAEIPVVLIAGDTAVEDKNNLQNATQREFVTVAGAGFEQVRTPGSLATDVATAFRRAVVERRPIVLNFPTDSNFVDIRYEPARFRIPGTKLYVPSGRDIDDAVGLIASAKRPIVLAGLGAVKARSAVLDLARRLDAPVATAIKAKDLFRGEERNLGICGTLSSPSTTDVIMSSDCIIALGASLNNYTTSSKAFTRGKRVLQIDANPAAFGKHMEPDVGLVGDVELAIRKIIEWLDEAEIPASGFFGEIRNEKSKQPEYKVSAAKNKSRDGTVDIRDLLRWLNKSMPAERIFVTDGGRNSRQAWRLISVEDPTLFVTTSHFGSIGLGMGEAIGASFVSNRPVLLVIGDGAFTLGGLAEFNTAVRNNSDLVVVVCSDGSYGSEHSHLVNKGMDPSVSFVDWPDFGDVATALGGSAFTIRSSDDFEGAAAAIRNRQGPLLIEAKIDPELVPRDAQFEDEA